MQPQPSAHVADTTPNASEAQPRLLSDPGGSGGVAPPREASGAARPSGTGQIDFSDWIGATSDPADLTLGEEGFVYADLFAPHRLAELTARFEAYFKATDPAAHAQFDAYRTRKGAAMAPEAISDALLAAAPHLSRFVARLFRVEREAAALIDGAKGRGPLWEFKKEFAKKRLFKPSAGTSWKGSVVASGHAARRTLVAMGAPAALLGGGSADEELAVAEAVLKVCEIDDTARRVAKAGGAKWTDELRARVANVRAALLQATASGGDVSQGDVSGLATADDGAVAAYAMDAIEAWLHARRNDHHDPARRWASLKAPGTLDHMNLVQLRRVDEKIPELFVGPADEQRRRQGFALTDRRMGVRAIESEVDYCLYCHDRDKDSCSKGLRDKSGAVKQNPLGVPLDGCPLEEKISEMHTMRKEGDSIAALAIVCIDNPLLPGTGHRICNDCMKACVFQKQDPVNIPEIETAVLTDVLALPWGFEIYGLLARWNPLNIKRPHPLPYNGKNVLIVGLGPAGYTLAHHLTSEGFACVGVDGLKIEPLPRELTGDEDNAPRPIRDFTRMYVELDERVLLGFGGVSEYGITVRWDKNFLTVLYVTLARQRLLRTYGGVRFGGTLDLDDAWKLGFDHVAIRGGRWPTDHHPAQEQHRARHPQGERLPHGPPADRRLQAFGHRQPADPPAGRGHRRRLDRHRHGDGAPRLLHRAGREDGGPDRHARRRAGRGRRPRLVRRGGAGVHRRAARARRRGARGAGVRREGGTPALLPAAARRVGWRLARVSQARARLAGLSAESRGGHQVPRGGRALHREHGARRGHPRRAWRREGDDLRAPGAPLGSGDEVEEQRRDPRAAGPIRPRRRRHQPERDLREGEARLVRLRQVEAVLPGALGGGRRRRQAPRNASRGEQGLLHELQRRQARGQLLRRQPAALCGQRRQGDGEREGRVPRGGGPLPPRSREARRRAPGRP